MESTNIYVLRLEGGRYYVGKTDDVARRFEQHSRGEGSAWTRKYKPLSIEKVFTGVSPFEEDKITKMFMATHGIHNVRGGSYVTEELSEFHLEALKMEIWSATNKCTRCGRNGHFVAKCYATKDVYGDVILDDDDDEEDDDEEEHAYTGHSSYRSSDACYRCGRMGHYASNCYARTYAGGYDSD